MYIMTDHDADLISRIADKILDADPLANRARVEMNLANTHCYVERLDLEAMLTKFSTEANDHARVRYSILDDFGEVLRWQWDKPSSNYKYVTQQVPREPRFKIDWNNFEPALF